MRLKVLINCTEKEFDSIRFSKSSYLEKINNKDNSLNFKTISAGKTIKQFTNEKIMVIFEIAGENEKSARVLSNIYNDIKSVYKLNEKFKILECGFSEYYNKMLYPLYNKFERYLRQLIYLAIQDNKSITKKALEDRDFDSLYKLLFIDNELCSRLEEKVINKITMKELLSIIKKSKEDYVLLDLCKENKELYFIRDKFKEVQKYRNTIMHAHNISTEDYKSAKIIIEKCNLILSNEINRLDPTAEIFVPELLEKYKIAFSNITKVIESIVNFNNIISKLNISRLKEIENLSNIISKINVPNLYEIELN